MNEDYDFFKNTLSSNTSLFTEAPEDEAPADDAPPDMDAGGDDDAPPDMDDGGNDDAPPDMDMGGGDGFGGDDFGSDDSGGDSDDGGYDFGSDETSADSDNDGNIGLDDKVSSILNMNLYQQYLALLREISNQLMLIKANSDILYQLSDKVNEIVNSLKHLEENMRLYVKNSFSTENYSKNLHFFNKCLNLFKLLTDSFNSVVHKGIRNM